MIANIIDNRTNKYNVNIDAVFEPSWHDNSIENATQFPQINSIMYEELTATTVQAAINHASQWLYPITFFLYDPESLHQTLNTEFEFDSGC